MHSRRPTHRGEVLWELTLRCPLLSCPVEPQDYRVWHRPKCHLGAACRWCHHLSVRGTIPPHWPTWLASTYYVTLESCLLLKGWSLERLNLQGIEATSLLNWNAHTGLTRFH